jgi:predicted HicB family RNase H-like nuclease
MQFTEGFEEKLVLICALEKYLETCVKTSQEPRMTLTGIFKAFAAFCAYGNTSS